MTNNTNDITIKNSLFTQLDDMIAEQENKPSEIQDEYLALNSERLLKFFERRRDLLLAKEHSPTLDPNGYGAIRDMAVLEEYNTLINLTKRITNKKEIPNGRIKSDISTIDD